VIPPDDRLQRYFDGELRGGDTRDLEEELSRSEPDQKRLAALGEMRTLLRESARDAAASAPSEEMWTAIRSEIAKGRQPSLAERLRVRWQELWAGPARYWVPAVAAAGCVMLVWALAARTPAYVAQGVVIESVETSGVTATVFQIPDEDDGEGIAVLVLTPEPEGAD